MNTNMNATLRFAGRESNCQHRGFMVYLLVILVLFTVNYGQAQEKDSLKAEQSGRNIWFNKPPTGQSEKTQGGLLMALGGISMVTGVIQMNKKDPCDDFSGPNVICTSNIDEVRTVGALTLGIGAGAVIYGIIRYGDGAAKAKRYQEWKKANGLSIVPRLRFNKSGVELGFSMVF